MRSVLDAGRPNQIRLGWMGTFTCGAIRVMLSGRIAVMMDGFRDRFADRFLAQGRRDVDQRQEHWLRVKYALDRVAAFVLLPLVSPLFAGVAVAIKLDDGGEIFFRQARVGLDGVVFRIWKFRTMIPGAGAIGGGYVPEGSNLVTRVGRFLRRTSLDEVPQILNVALGDMSFVGPRPAVPEHVERYTAKQRIRLSVKPGIVGWAQLHGRNALTWSKRIEYDLEYVERASLLFDTKILLRSVPAVFRGSGVREYQTAEDVDDIGVMPE